MMYRNGRRLSAPRVFLALILLATTVVGSLSGFKQWHQAQAESSDMPWFAAYVDVTSTPTYAFDQMGATTNRDAILSFIVSSSKDACTPSWGDAYNLDQAGDSLDLDRRVARLKQQGGSVAISFGGLNNHELAVGCTDNASLLNAYRSVIERYDINTIDLDLEGKDLTNKEANVRRATVLAQLQKERRADGKKLAVWATLPVTPKGLSEDGSNAVTELLNVQIDLAGLNVMTMDYGTSKEAGQSMQTASESALTQSVRQLGVLYQRAGIRLANSTLWSKIGATPMIGQNDVASEVFTLKDAYGLNKFALSRGAGRMSMWSANRDVSCGSNYVNTKVVSDSCSGVKDGKRSFTVALSTGLKGSLSLSAGLVTTPDKSSNEIEADDPATSPYQIWSETGAYLEGTKVVWHHNVYRAKWWTQNDLPDNPVLQEWQTPWELVGPVLPGEKPIKQPTVPTGTYPEWNGNDAYQTGTRVLFNGLPYKAKWWNRGESPAAASSNASTSSWTPLTQAEINALNL